MASTGKKVTISKSLGLIPGSQDTVQIKWTVGSSWDQDIDHFNVYWYEKLKYVTNGKTTYSWDTCPQNEGKKYELSGKANTATYTVSANCIAVAFSITPVAKYIDPKKTSKGRKWTGTSVGGKTTSSTLYEFKENPSEQMPAPTISQIEGTDQLKFEVNNWYDTTVDMVMFRKAKVTSTGGYKDYEEFTADYSPMTRHARYVWSGAVGGNTYVVQVKCRNKNTQIWQKDTLYSDLSDPFTMAPQQNIDLPAPTLTSLTSHSVRVSFTADNFDDHTISYVSDPDDWNTDREQRVSVSDGATHYDLDVGDTGGVYYFRYRRENESGSGGWSKISQIALGLSPNAPTVWETTATMEVGTKLKVYWVHNPRDNSKETQWEIEWLIGEDTITDTGTDTPTTDPYDPEKTHEFEFDSSLEKYGIDTDIQIQYRVRTKGVTNTWSEFSAYRPITLWQPQTISLSLKNGQGETVTTLTSLPLVVEGTFSVLTQLPISWQLTITNDTSYEITDEYGEDIIVPADTIIFNRNYDINTALTANITAADVSLATGISYTVKLTGAFTSGILKNETMQFTTDFDAQEHVPDCRISIDPDYYTAFISAWCVDDDTQEPLDDILLSVYRKNVDGTFTMIVDNVDNDYILNVVDPHPALDFARYRVCAKSTVDGSVNYADFNEYIGEKSAVITWNENLPANTEDTEASMYGWAGTMLKLKWNVDIQDASDKDTSLVEYIGRKHPVAYYGTQLGMTSTWSSEIPKTDSESLELIRLLQQTTSDVYVREGYGTGYWAKVDVTYDIKHNSTTIPVTINVSRTDGGEAGVYKATVKSQVINLLDNINGIEFDVNSSGQLYYETDATYNGGEYGLNQGQIGVEVNGTEDFR